MQTQNYLEAEIDAPGARHVIVRVRGGSAFEEDQMRHSVEFAIRRDRTSVWLWGGAAAVVLAVALSSGVWPILVAALLLASVAFYQNEQKIRGQETLSVLEHERQASQALPTPSYDAPLSIPHHAAPGVPAVPSQKEKAHA